MDTRHAHALEGALVDLEERFDLAAGSVEERVDDLEERVERLEAGRDDLLREMRQLTRAAARIANAATDLAELPQSTNAKKRLLLRLWQGLDAASRQSFIRYVSGEAEE